MSQVNYPVQRLGEDRVDLRSLIEVLIRRRWIILAVALPVILVATIGTLRGAQLYLARGTLMIEIAGPQSPAFGRFWINHDVILSSAAELGQSVPVASRAALALADSLPAYRERFPEHLSRVMTVADLQEVLHGGVTTNHVGESNMINLSFTHTSPQFALIGARALADAFIDFNIESRRISPAVEYYAEQIEATQREFEELVARRTAVQEASGLTGLAVDARQSLEQIRNLENQYFQARSLREGLEARLRAFDRAIAADPNFVPTVGVNEATSLDRLKADLDTRVARLVTLRDSYQEDSIFIQRELQQIAAMQTELNLERERYLQTLRVRVAEARSIEQSYFAAQQGQARNLEVFPAVRGQIETLDLRIDGLRRLLQNQQQKLGEVRMAADSDLRISDVKLIEDPVLDVPIGRGRKILYLLIASFLAIALALVVAFFVESNDHRIYDRRRAELYLEVPVLGSLPDTSRQSRA
jgi:uncharacterized protein involved in exopolysaccharide biosynthesis